MKDSAVSVRHIDFAFSREKLYHDFSLEIKENDVFFIMGINGCGKTTLLKIICSFLQVSAGSVLINGKNLHAFDRKSLAKEIAYVPQIINLNSEFLVRDYLLLGRTPHIKPFESMSTDDHKVVEQYALELGLESYYDIEFNALSGGQKQLVAICRALIQETPIIILDEPMSALDIGKQAEFLALLKELKASGKTVVLTSHNPNHAFALRDVCTVCFIHEHNILGLGDCASVLTGINVQRVFGEKVRIDEDGNGILFNIN